MNAQTSGQENRGPFRPVISNDRDTRLGDLKVRDPLLSIIATLIFAIMIAATITTSTASCLEIAVETRKNGSIVIYDYEPAAKPITRYKILGSFPKKSIEIGALKAGDTNSACRRAPNPRRSAD